MNMKTFFKDRPSAVNRDRAVCHWDVQPMGRYAQAQSRARRASTDALHHGKAR